MKNLATKSEDEGDPRVMSEFAKNREAKITGMARERLRLYEEEMKRQGKTAFQTPEEYQEKLEEEKYNIKYFPVLFVSAPHIEPVFPELLAVSQHRLCMRRQF